MTTNISSLHGIYVNYYVMFDAEVPKGHYSPIVAVPSINKSIPPGGLHGFDPELIGILPALWYCLHLPRIGFDTMSLPPDLIANGYEVPHNINLIPSFTPAPFLQSMATHEPPTLVRTVVTTKRINLLLITRLRWAV
jgi:hypothetical protein